MTINIINPATEILVDSYEAMTTSTVEKIIEKVQEDYLQWRHTPFKERSQCMRQIAELLKKNKKIGATLIAEEMGKPITAGMLELEKCAWVCEYYASHAEQLLQPRIVETELKKSYVVYKPLGIIFAIMPWNFPFWQVFRFAAPNLMAGNGCLLKQAAISTRSALHIEKWFREAGFPEHIFRTIIINTIQTDAVIHHPHIAGVTLTGSAEAGRSVAQSAGNALKKVVLELGGSDPYIILKDADLEQAAFICLTSRLANSGQVCIAAKRIIIVDSVYDTFLKIVMDKIVDFRMGDPLDPSTQIGPLARSDLRDHLHQQVAKSLEIGAQLLIGGVIPNSKGFYYPLTLLSNVKPGMPAFDEELFGPVVSLIRAKDEKEAIMLANQTPYGLGAAVFTKNTALGEKIAMEQLEAGGCAVNIYVKSDPRLPFGGIKESGFGRELGPEGIHAFMNVKTIMVG